MIKVSIIIPVHNSIEYLCKCLDSCLHQTLKEIEVIAVDDCSEDDSPKLLAEYEQSYPLRFRAIYLNENIRQGGARNAGIRAAQGEYLAFVDSDDWIELDMCKCLYDLANGADLVGSNYYVSDNYGDIEKILPYRSDHVGEMDEDKRLFYLNRCGMFWTRLYRRDFIIQNKLFFPEKTYYEDAWFNFMTALYADKIEKCEGFFYHYFQSSNSTMRSRNKPHQYERIGIADRIWDDCMSRKLYESHRDSVEFKYLYMMAANVLYTCLGQFDKPDAFQLQRCRDSVLARMPEYKKSMAYKELSDDLCYYFTINMHSPKAAIIAYTHNLYRFRAKTMAIKKRLTRKDNNGSHKKN